MYNRVESELLEGVRQGLTGQCEKLSPETLSRLQSIREEAMGQTDKRHEKWSFFSQTVSKMPVAPLSAALSVGVLGIVLLMAPGGPVQNYLNSGEGEHGYPVSDVIDDVDVLMSNEDMEFLENLEVYEWLDAEYG